MTRKAALLFFAIALVVILLPAAVVSLGSSAEGPPDAGKALPEGDGERESSTALQLRLYRADRKEVVVMDLEEYLEGVLLAEIPASFEMEALKAQAVVARTYAMRQMRSRGGSGCERSPESADICSDSTHCQAWLDPEETVTAWGPESSGFLERVRQAIAETSGEAALYQGKLIEAVYHSTCGGRTEASHALWSGGALPYLQSVNCPYCKHSPHYRGELTVSYAQLAAALPQEPALPVVSNSRLLLEVGAETSGGRVATLKINEMLIEGKELRELLAMPSTAFTWEIGEEGLLFHTRGQGHGVGLCQYGADGAARQGKNYRQIIMFYYPGAEVAKYLP